MLALTESQSPDKERALKSLMISAWKSRWDEQTWAVAIRKVIPYGVSGDSFNLASLILQLAVVGRSVSDLLLGYLRHAVCTRLVSPPAVLVAVSSLQVPDCGSHVLRLLSCVRLVEFVVTDDRILCIGGNHDNNRSLPSALAGLVVWLCSLSVKVANSVADIQSDFNDANIYGGNNTNSIRDSSCDDDLGDSNIELAQLIDALRSLVRKIAGDRFLMCLLHLSPGTCSGGEDAGSGSVVNSNGDNKNKVHSVNPLVKSTSQQMDFLNKAVHTDKCFSDMTVGKQLIQINDCLRSIIDFSALADTGDDVSSAHSTAQVHCLLRAALIVELACVRARPPASIAHRLLLIARARHVTPFTLVYTIVRTCWECLVQSHDCEWRRYWVQFSFHRLPKVLQQIHMLCVNSTCHYSDEVIGHALCSLAEDSCALVNHVDSLYGGTDVSLLSLLWTELTKITQFDECGVTAQLQELCSRNQHLFSATEKTAPANSDSAASILRAEPTVRSILSTMEVQLREQAGVSKLSTVLLHLLGPSQHLVIGAAVGTGQLPLLIKHLISLNQLCVSNSSDGGADSGESEALQSQQLVFEMSFLIVLTTVKNYGVNALPAPSASSVSEPEMFLVRWLHRFFNDDALSATAHDQASVVSVGESDGAERQQLNELQKSLHQLVTDSDSYLTRRDLNWHQLCLHAVPQFCEQLVVAWHHERYSDEQVKHMVDKCNKQHVCVSVCIVASLLKLSRVLDSVLADRCGNLVEMFIKSSSDTAATSSAATAFSACDSASSTEHNQERLLLAHQLMLHLQRQRCSVSDVDTCRLLLHGRHVSTEHVLSVRRVLSVRGADWLVRTCVNLCAELPFGEDRQSAMDTVLAMCCVQPEMCCVSLTTLLISHIDQSTCSPGNSAVSGSSHCAPSEQRLASLARTVVTCLLVCQQQWQRHLSADCDSAHDVDDRLNDGVHLTRISELVLLNNGGDDGSDEDSGVMLWPDSNSGLLSAVLQRCVSVLADSLLRAAMTGTISTSTQLAMHYLLESWRQCAGCERSHQMAALLHRVSISCVWRLMCLQPHCFSADMLATLGDTDQPAVANALAALICQHRTLLIDDQKQDVQMT